MIIDSHQHFWQVGRFEYPWLSPSLGVLYRDYLPADLAPLIAAAGVDATIIVQASPTIAESDWLLALAAEHPFVAGVVGWLDLESDAFARQLDAYRRKPKFVGVRPAVEFIRDDRWLVRPRVIESLRAIADADLPLDLIVWPRHLPAVLDMLDHVRGLCCVVDHLAKPDVRAGVLEPWATLIARTAQHPNVLCKLSGLMTQADHQRWRFADLAPYFEHVLSCFGPQRVMFGTDWPVSLLASGYAATLDVVRQACPAESHDAVLGGNARRFYNLTTRRINSDRTQATRS